MKILNRLKKITTPDLSTEELIEEIHNEFNTAADKLLKEANNMLSTLADVDKTKAEELIALGFRKVGQVESFKENNKKRKTSEEALSIVSYFKETYPDYKFITEPQVKEICDKYNLIYGGVSRFTGFVPRKNLDEIKSFKGVKPEDKRYIMRNVFRDIESNYHQYKIYKEQDSYESHIRSSWVLEDSELIIAAPLRDMDTKGYDVVNKKLVKHIPDPVVMKPVRGGYLILTAWGEESSDPLIKK